MAFNPTLRIHDIDLPACPQVLVQMSVLMHDERANLRIISELIETDMALASAVVRTVNSAHFGLPKRVESVPEAVRFLGTREVSALTYGIGLRAAFAPRPLLTALWDRAGKRGLAMGRAAPPLELDPWLAHTAGLFAESGQAALVMHDTDRYEALLASTPDAFAQLEGETALYGISHAGLGAALCEAWGLSLQVAAVVRQRPAVLLSLADSTTSRHPDAEAPWLTEPLGTQQLLALGAVVDAALDGVDGIAFARCCAAVGPVAGLDAAVLGEAAMAAVERVSGR